MKVDKMDVHKDMDVYCFHFLKQQRYVCKFYIILEFQALLDVSV